MHGVVTTDGNVVAGMGSFLFARIQRHLPLVERRKKRAQEALSYNALVQSWPEIARLAAEAPGTAVAEQGTLYDA